MNRCRTFLALLLLVVWLPYHAHAAGIEFDADDDATCECHCSGHDMAGGSAPLKVSAAPVVECAAVWLVELLAAIPRCEIPRQHEQEPPGIAPPVFLRVLHAALTVRGPSL